MNEFDKMIAESIINQKQFNKKPKKEAVFSFNPAKLKITKPIYTEYDGVKYFHMECVFDTVDKEPMMGTKHTVQLSTKRDLFALAKFLKKNKLEDKTNVKVKYSFQSKIANFRLLH